MADRRVSSNRRILSELDPDALYVGSIARVSTQGQAAPEKTSLEQQLAANRVKAQMMADREGKRLVIVKEWVDDVSGTLAPDKRPSMSEALDFARAGRIQVLMSFTDDRAARLMRHGSRLVDELEDAGVRYAVCDADYLYDDDGRMLPESRLMQNMRTYFAETERRSILEKTARGRRGQAKNGKAPIRNQAPFGYHIRQKWEAQAGRCSPEEVGDYVIVEEQAAIVRQMFERLAEGGSLRTVTRWLQDELCLPTVRGHKTWNPRTVHRMVTDTVYKGEGHYSDGGNMILIPTPAVVTPLLWQRAYDAIKRNRTMQSGAPDVRYLLSGFLRCPDCGSSMCGRLANSGQVRYYQCVRRQSDAVRAKHDDTPRCKFPFVPGDSLEALAGKTLAETVIRQACLAKAMERFQGELRKMKASGVGQSERLQTLRMQWGAASKAYDAAINAVERILQHDPEADLSVFVGRSKQHRERRDILAERISEVEKEGSSAVTDALLALDANAFAAHVCSMLSRLPELFDSSVLSITEKRFILDAAVDKIVPVNERPEKQRYRKWGVEIELRPDLLSSAIMVGAEVSQGVGLSLRPTC